MKKQNTDRLFQIGELSEKAKVSKRTIRYYEEIGLLLPSRITSGGFRLYTVNNLHRLEIIKDFKKIDFSLDQIKEILLPGPNHEKEDQIKYSQHVLETQISSIQSEIDKLKEVKDKNQMALEMLNQCEKCKRETCPQGCSNLKAFL